MLKLNQLTVTGRLSAVNIEVNEGCLIYLVGPNGAGKSTLLACIAGLLEGQGEIIIANKEIANYSAAQLAVVRSYLSQQQVYHHVMPIFQYLALHQPANSNPGKLEETVEYLCDKLELTDKLAKPVASLSGGEWQRVRLAANFLQIWPTINPNSLMLLLDEPMNSLDVCQQAAVTHLILEIINSGRLVIMSSHDLNQSLHHADYVWLMNKGYIVDYGLVDDIIIPDKLSSIFNVTFSRYWVNNKYWITAQ